MGGSFLYYCPPTAIIGLGTQHLAICNVRLFVATKYQQQLTNGILYAHLFTTIYIF